MRTRTQIEADHRRVLAELAVTLESLAVEDRAVAGYLTSKAVSLQGQARRVREWLATAHEAAALSRQPGPAGRDYTCDPSEISF